MPRSDDSPAAYAGGMEPGPADDETLAVDPPQPAPVVRALEELLADPRPAVDPWWRAGSDEALGA